MSWHEQVRATNKWCVINCHSQCLPFLDPYLASYLDDLFLIITFYLFDQKYLLSPKLSEFPILSPPSTPWGFYTTIIKAPLLFSTCRTF